MKKLLIRTASGTVYVALIILAIYCFQLVQNRKVGYVVFATIFLFFAIVGVYEFYHNIRRRGIAVNATVGSIIALAVYGLLSIVNVAGSQLGGRLLPLVPAILMVAPLQQLWRHDEHPFATIGYTLIPTLWIVLPLVLLQKLWIWNPFLCLMLFVCIWVNDSFAYLTGMAFGRHPMWPRHSPHKTWEGTLGGALCCMIVAIVIGYHCYDASHFYAGSLQWWHWMVLGLIASVTGTLGDLVESMFKRSCGVKDSGTIMPGHGGILDRLDSLFMATPFAVAFFAFFASGL